MLTLVFLLSALLLFNLPAQSATGDADAAGTREGLDAFRAYLKKTYPDKKWQQGPSRLDSPALRAAYRGQRFYYVYSSPPLTPGANIESVQDAHRRQVEDIRNHYISIAVRVDGTGQVMPLRNPPDYNGGLIKVTSEDDARTAAAAILSLQRCDHVTPAAVDARDIVVTRADKGWSCECECKGFFQGTVSFDRDSKCTGISKAYAGPLPP
jgi:hypothetical protein